MLAGITVFVAGWTIEDDRKHLIYVRVFGGYGQHEYTFNGESIVPHDPTVEGMADHYKRFQDDKYF